MLQQFHVPDDIAVRVPHQGLFNTVKAIFLKLRMPDQDATQAAKVLTFADLRGIETHGVSNLMKVYVEWLNDGRIHPTPKWKITSEYGAIANISGDGGLGLVLGPIGMQMAIDKAEKHGIGSVTMSNAGHLGPCAYTAMMPIDHDMIGLSMTTGGVGMVPTFGSKPMVGINPLGFAAPTRNEPPFVFDAAMSGVAGNKVELAKRLGVDLSPGWIAQPDGTPIMEKGPVPEEYSFLPLGGTRELGSHKGYSLALMIDILTGVLSGNGPGFQNNMVFSHYFCAIKIEAFTRLQQFKRDMDEYMRALVNTPPAPGFKKVVYAGLPEHETEIDRRTNGIPLHPEVVDWFADIASELTIENSVHSL